MSPRYVLRRQLLPAAAPPLLDASQRAVVAHPGGPLLVLAGPGTGKTTTLVEVVIDRVERRGLRPDQVLVLTFSRKAADDVRARVMSRLRRTTAAPMATTFHAFCYALVRRFQDPETFAAPLQLLSAAEQDVRIRELLAGTVRSGAVSWPPSMLPALTTRGLASETQRILSRARERGLDPDDVVAAGREQGRPEWVAAGQFFAEYLDVFDSQNLLDYAELVHRANLTLRESAARDLLRRQIRLVVVDEYQDTDPSQVDILRQLVGSGGDLIAVGDPDQSVYAFRGAEVGGLLRFPHEFPQSDGRPAPTLALRSTRRFGEVILRASRSVIARSSVRGSLDEDTFRAFRHPVAIDPVHGEGTVSVQTFSSPAAEAEQIAAMLRRCHLDEGIPWSSMAVLVRSGPLSIPRLQRALLAADIPVEVTADEVSLRSQPAVQTLLIALRVVAQPALLDAPTAEALLTSPLGAMDPVSVRRLARRLRREDRDLSASERLPRPSGELLAAAVAHPEVLAALDGVEAARAIKTARVLEHGRALLAAKAPLEETLWAIWSSTSWPQRLQAKAERGGPAARSAHRDLDAVCALFAFAARAEERQQRRGLQQFLDELDNQEIAAQTLAEQGVRGDAVRMLTAHRAKGAEWRLVVVAGVQEGTWPDLRRRRSFLEADRLDRHGAGEPATTAELLEEERRLFYVAVTRAQERLIVTAVASASDDGDQPSRFIHDLDVTVGAPLGRPTRPVSLRGALAQLRRIAETSDDPVIRAAVAQRIARLAGSGKDGSPLLACAHPDRWWGVLDLTESQTPVRPVEEPLALSGSSVAAMASCPLAWFLGREAGGASVSTTAQGFGSALHTLAESVATTESVDDSAVLQAHLGSIWDQLPFFAPWVSTRERSAAEAALRRFIAWHGTNQDRHVLAAEYPFEVELPVGGERVRLRGFMDRVEVDRDGRVVVVDLKTSRTTLGRAEVSQHGQLGVYQLAVRHGALSELVDSVTPGGAELVQLRQDAPHQSSGLPRVQRQEPLESDDSPVVQHLSDAVRAMRAEEFPATPGEGCRYCDFRACCPAQPEGLSILAPQQETA